MKLSLRYACGLLAVALVLPARAATPARYVVFEVDRNGVATVYSLQFVDLRGALESDPVDRVSATSLELTPRDTDSIVVDLLDASGRPSFRKAVTVDRFMRLEWQDPASGEMRGRTIEREKSSFAVRLPAAGGDVVSVFHRRTGTRSRFDLRDIEPLPRAKAMKNASVSSLPDNRLDVLIMGDGYTAAQATQFSSDADNLSATFFGLSPYTEYSNYVRTSKLFTASNQSGADHPDCSVDPGAVTDPLSGTYVDTAFDATYCSYNQQRLLTINQSKVLTAAAANPDADKIFVLVNDTMYGGSGGPILVGSLNTYSTQIIQHEFGHSFTRLTDEYTTSNPGFPSCTDLGGGTACEPNATDQTTASLIKWKAWIKGTTVIPTPSSDTTDVGLFLGARYTTSKYYRPKYDCTMNHLGVPFCEVCREAFVLRLYQGWTRSDGTAGSPASGIDLIEPGTESPATGQTVAGSIGLPMQFSFTLLQPTGGPVPTVAWTVDGTPQSGTTSMTWTPSSNGTHTVLLTVTDGTTFVSSASTLYAQKSRSWTVSVSGPGLPASLSATATASSVALAWSAAAGASTYEVWRSVNGGAFSAIATGLAATNYSDNAVTPGNAYVYKVRGVDTSPGPFSAQDLATVFAPTDDPLPSGAVIKAAHLSELRTAIDLARAAAGLGAAVYTNSIVPGSVIRAVDVSEMRSAIAAARSALGMPVFSFSDSTLTAGSTPVKKAHVDEMRAAIR